MYVSPSFVPLFGDFPELQEEYEAKGKFLGHYFRDRPTGPDLKSYLLFIAGSQNIVVLNNPAVFAEFAQKVPT